MKDQVLFPKIEVREKGFLQVSDIHTIYWERSGNPNGKKNTCYSWRPRRRKSTKI